MMMVGGAGLWLTDMLLMASVLTLAVAAPPPFPGPGPSAPAPVLVTPGDSARFSWTLPSSLTEGVLLVSRDTPSTILFLAITTTATTTTPSSSSHPSAAGGLESSTVIMSDYSGRVQVADTLAQGVIQFTLSNVTWADAGQYFCTRGLTEMDIVKDCGNTLVVLDAPVNASITANGPLLVGSDVNLSCAASSVSKPRGYPQPMRFKWFESHTDHQSSQPTHWTQVEQVHGDPPLGRHFKDVEVGSGDLQPEDLKGSHSDPVSEVLQLKSLGRAEEGRRFACAASEGLGRWSAHSAPFVLRPEWKPLPSDLTLTPTGSSLTLTSGESKNITCNASCRPDCVVTWKKVTSDTLMVTLSKDRTLRLTRVGPQHQGLYRCQASNPHGSAFIAFNLGVKEAPKPWYRDNRLVITVIVVTGVGLALGMTGVAIVVYKCRQRTTPFNWPRHRVTQDAVPLSMVTNRPSLSSF